MGSVWQMNVINAGRFSLDLNLEAWTLVWNISKWQHWNCRQLPTGLQCSEFYLVFWLSEEWCELTLLWCNLTYDLALYFLQRFYKLQSPLPGKTALWWLPVYSSTVTPDDPATAEVVQHCRSDCESARHFLWPSVVDLMPLTNIIFCTELTN